MRSSHPSFGKFWKAGDPVDWYIFLVELLYLDGESAFSATLMGVDLSAPSPTKSRLLLGVDKSTPINVAEKADSPSRRHTADRLGLGLDDHI